ncbi:hypothetical protein CR513_04008, partial [Mucuna pruriens]
MRSSRKPLKRSSSTLKCHLSSSQQYQGRPNPLPDNARRINGLCFGTTRHLRKERTDHILSQQEIHRLRIKIPNAEANLLCSSLGSKKVETVHASPYYVAHSQDRPPQVHLRKTSTDKMNNMLANGPIMLVEETGFEFESDRWKLWFDGASNLLGNRIGAVLASPSSQCFSFSARLGFDCTDNMAEYEACAMGIAMALEH